MTKRKMTEIPLVIVEGVQTPPVKPSGRRIITDLDELSAVPDDTELIIQYGSKTFKATKANLMSPLTSNGLWDDYVGALSAGAKQSTNVPSFDVIRGHNRAHNFAVGDELWITIHVKHDWKPGTDMYPHIHWCTNDASPAGNAVWSVHWSIAKRNDITPEPFPDATEITLSAPMTTQYGHVVTEADDTSSPSQIIPAAEIEIDCLIMLHLIRLTDGGAGGDAKSLFGIQLDLHYQKDRLGTPLKAPPFRT